MLRYLSPEQTPRSAGQDEALMRGELHRITLWVAGAFVVLGAMYYLFVHRQMKAEKK